MLPDNANAENRPVGDTYDGAVNAPDLTIGLKPKRRAIKDAIQAMNIIKTMETASRERNIKNARIASKYNSEKPYTTEALLAEGLSWKSNFTTKPLPMLIDKVAPRFWKAVEGVKYFTNSALPDEVEGASTKTEAFRREITKTVRSHPDWQNFNSDLAQENALFGFAAVAWLDEFHWMPKFFRQDQFFLPSGSKQSPNACQVVPLREVFLLHELFSLVEDKTAAEARGWDVEQVVRALNEATPINRRSQQTTWERIHEDMIRESNLGMSHESGPRGVAVWHLLATEVDGQVSHYILLDKSFKVLFTQEDQYDSMADALGLFAFQQGNGTVHGSKGIGRELYAMAGILDRSRNEVVDRLALAGKIIIQGDPKALRRFKMSVVGNAILIEQGFQISEKKLDSGVEPFLKLDQFLTALLDQMAGATTPKAFEGDRVTKAQVEFFAQREEESRDSIISRYLTQFARMMTTIQRRLCDPNTDDTDAKEMQKRLLKIMTREELTLLSKQPVAETVRDYTELKRQQIVAIAAEAQGNPLYNQKALQFRKVTAQIDEEFANEVLLPDEDPTVQSEQSRLQALELLLIVGQGAEVPVSPRDNHEVHLKIVMPVMESTAQQAIQDPHAVDTLHALLAHAEAHYNAAVASGTPKETLAPVESVITKLRSQMDKLNELAQQHHGVNDAVDAHTAGALPPEAGPLDAAAAENPPPAPPQ
jgi:hypothetical protein